MADLFVKLDETNKTMPLPFKTHFLDAKGSRSKILWVNAFFFGVGGRSKRASALKFPDLPVEICPIALRRRQAELDMFRHESVTFFSHEVHFNTANKPPAKIEPAATTDRS